MLTRGFCGGVKTWSKQPREDEGAHHRQECQGLSLELDNPQHLHRNPVWCSQAIPTKAGQNRRLSQAPTRVESHSVGTSDRIEGQNPISWGIFHIQSQLSEYSSPLMDLNLQLKVLKVGTNMTINCAVGWRLNFLFPCTIKSIFHWIKPSCLHWLLKNPLTFNLKAISKW